MKKCPQCNYPLEKHCKNIGLTEEEENQYIPCEYCSVKAEVATLESSLAQKDEQFAEHTKAVGRFLSQMYAVMVDPLEDSELKVAEMCEVLLNAACENRQALQDQIDRAGNLPANWKEDSSIETWFPLTAEEFTRTKAKLQTAEATLGALMLWIEEASAKVTSEEWQQADCEDGEFFMQRWRIDALLASRLQQLREKVAGLQHGNKVQEINSGT